MAGYGGMYKVGWRLAIYNMCRWGCGIYSGCRAFLVLYSMNRGWLAIYRVGGVGTCDILSRAGVSTGAALECESIES